jgi:hypothetical protein
MHATSTGGNLDAVNQTIWEELLTDDLVSGNPNEEAVVCDEPEVGVELRIWLRNLWIGMVIFRTLWIKSVVSGQTHDLWHKLLSNDFWEFVRF